MKLIDIVRFILYIRLITKRPEVVYKIHDLSSREKPPALPEDTYWIGIEKATGGETPVAPAIRPPVFNG